MTQVYITPTHEQLNEFLKDDPLFVDKIKNDSYQILNQKAQKYLSSRLYNEAQNTFNKLLEKEKSKYFKKDNYGYFSSFSTEIENALVEQINVFFKENLQQNVIDYMKSDEFTAHINSEIKQKITQYVLKNLDEQIKLEAKKLVE